MYFLSESCALGAFLYSCSFCLCMCIFPCVQESFVCVCACMFVCVCVCKCKCVLVGFIPREDSFPQQALSGCFWAHSVHSWRQLLSPAYLTSLLSSPLLSFLLLTLMSVIISVNYASPCNTQIHCGATFYKAAKLKVIWSLKIGNKITPKRLQTLMFAL